MNIFNIIRGKKKVRDEYMGGNNKFITRWARPPSMNTAEWLSMFSTSPRLAVVDRIASDLASVSGHLYRVEKDGVETEITDHPFLDFMSNPNPLYEMTSSAIWRLHEVYLALVGESFLIIERDEFERPIELWNVPPQWVKQTPHLDYPFYDVISSDGITMSVPVDDMFIMKSLNPLNPFMRGLGPAESIADEVEIDEYAAKFQKRFFYNDATPPIVFIMPDATADQRQAFMAEWNKEHKGLRNRHKAAAITGNMDVKVLNGSGGSQNLDFMESRIAMRDAVLEHFGVPREIMGITENSNRATADSAQYIYAKNVLTPRLDNRENAINKQLLPLFGDNLVWRFDPVIPYDKEFNKEKAVSLYNSGIIMKNEARNLSDLPNIEGGNVFKTSINDVFISEKDDPVEVSRELLSDESEVKSMRRVNISAMLKKEDLAIKKNGRLFEAAISQYFIGQGEKIAKAFSNGKISDGDTALSALDEYLTSDGTFDPYLWAELSEEQQQRIAVAISEGLLDWRNEAKKLNELFTPLWKQTYDDGVQLSLESYNLENVSRPEFVSAAKINGGKRVVGIQKTTRDSVAKIISNGIANGVSQNTLRDEIIEEMKTNKTRAKLIARQETSTALATGQFDMMISAGAKTKTWHHRPQKDPRDGTNGKVDHVRLDGETVSVN